MWYNNQTWSFLTQFESNENIVFPKICVDFNLEMKTFSPDHSCKNSKEYLQKDENIDLSNASKVFDFTKSLSAFNVLYLHEKTCKLQAWTCVRTAR